jgi:hypothetical protein
MLPQKSRDDRVAEFLGVSDFLLGADFDTEELGLPHSTASSVAEINEIHEITETRPQSSGPTRQHEVLRVIEGWPRCHIRGSRLLWWDPTGTVRALESTRARTHSTTCRTPWVRALESLPGDGSAASQ